MRQMPSSEEHQRHMRHCLELALKAEDRTSPNPMVGAVVLDAEGIVVGEGFHEKAGKAHAEVMALNQAGESARGGTLYVSLEPCNHHGRTPPCTEKVVASGIKHVVAPTLDPNPVVCGKGFAALKAAKIAVTTGLLREESIWINRGYFSAVTRSRPWLCLKLASTLDGKIADRNGKSRWITGEKAQAYVHELRNAFDCVLIGSATARLDDPLLNVRGTHSSRNPVRAVVQGNTPLPANLKMFSQELEGRTVIFCSEEILAKFARAYPPQVQVVPVPSKAGYPDLKSVLLQLYEFGLNTVLCEGGAKLAGSLLNEKLVDEIKWFFAPKILVDSKALPAVAGSLPKPLEQAVPLAKTSVQKYGEDFLMEGIMADSFILSPDFLLLASDKDKMDGL